MTDPDSDLDATLRSAPGERVERCAACDAPLRPDQRYCLGCGARHGAPRIDFAAFWRRPGGSGGTTGGAAEPAGTADPPRGSRLRSRRIGAAAAGLVLAVGIAVGDLLAPGPSSSLASVSGPLQASVLSAIAATERSGATSGAGTPETSASTPQAEAEAGQSAAEAEEEAPAGEAPSEGAAGEAESGDEGSGVSGASEGNAGNSEGNAGTGKQGESGESATEAPLPTTQLQRVKHVWVIMLSGSSFKQALAQKSSDPYLAKQLLPKGALLSDYSLVAASPLANDIALLSGQSANAATEEDCPAYEAMQPQTVEAKGLTEGIGCVYPAAAKTLADQVSEADLTWRAYMQDMAPAGATAAGEGDTPAGTATADTTAATTTTTTETAATETSATETTTTQTTQSPATGSSANPAEASTTTCRHPALGGAEAAQTPSAGADYVTYRNPFVYFDSLLEDGACTGDDLDLSGLEADLAKPQSTPSLSWISPSICDDGQQTKCGPKGSTGLAAADAFLHETVPPILATKAYKEEGLILIAFDQGPATQGHTDEPGAVVGALLLSPFVKPGVSDAHEFDNYSLLKSLERLYGVPLLGHANDEGLEELGAGVYSTAAKAAQATASSRRGAKQSGG